MCQGPQSLAWGAPCAAAVGGGAEWLLQRRRGSSGNLGKALLAGAASLLLLGQGAEARAGRAPTLFRSASMPDLRGSAMVRNKRLEDVQLDPSAIPSSGVGWGFGDAFESGHSSPGGEVSEERGGEGYFSASRRHKGIQKKGVPNLRRSMSVRNSLSDESGNTTPSPETKRSDAFYRATTGPNDYTKLQLQIYPEIQELK